MTSTQTESDAPRTEEAPAELFDIARDEIPSFGALEQQRAKIYERRTTLESFRRKVEALSESGEEGRRKGLGLWLVGELEQAVDLLARHEKDDVAAFTRANALMSLGRPAEAVPIFERLTKDYPDEPRPRAGLIEARLEASLADGDEEAAAAALEEDLSRAPKSFAGGAEELYLRGRAAELMRERQAAIDLYDKAREIQPTHRRNLFRLAHLAERTGLDVLALDAYRKLASELPIDRNVLVNLGVLYEDMGREQDAATCFDTVLKSDPTDRRARLFLTDARAGMNMFYDEDMERKEDRLNQILRIPITDFELSVRARNCLNKMDIMTLGDLVKKTEAELLAYKNFGETSLNEIKEILASKGLRLGMAREEAVASIARSSTTPRVVSNDPSDARNKTIAELKLSIRARRTIENLGCLTLGDVTQHTEEELLGMPNFGVTSLLELKNKLAEYGLKIKSD